MQNGPGLLSCGLCSRCLGPGGRTKSSTRGGPVNDGSLGWGCEDLGVTSILGLKARKQDWYITAYHLTFVTTSCMILVKSLDVLFQMLWMVRRGSD